MPEITIDQDEMWNAHLAGVRAAAASTYCPDKEAHDRREAENANGWSNRETYKFALLIDNDEGLHETSREIIRNAANDLDNCPTPQEIRGCMMDAADALKAWWEGLLEDMAENAPQHFATVLAPMIREIGSEWRINHLEIVEAWAQDCLNLDALGI